MKIDETNLNFRVEAGTQTCFFENGKPGQFLELYYQVLDGQHGDLDISVDIQNPDGTKILTDYKKSQNSIILELEQEGDYVICLDNTFSMMNSKLVFIDVVLEDRTNSSDAEVTIVNEEGEELEEIVDWVGTDTQGNTYNLDVRVIISSLTRCLEYVLKARHMLDVYSAIKTRDSYVAMEETFIVDFWSGLQVTFMIIVGLLQVYMIKKLFHNPNSQQKTLLCT
ncbi:transmembrane emp24 domain-containing protein 5-like [Aricia agestis]|uniref:transmembrane emp24 domain-containing protein 5-like n=1 Tax=Aricia agestis TaxID=91739 RepID=UPI001C202F8C|nr:transmembrane emp24 domain-containing protein 5-like [Aricia agestis]